MKMKTELYQKLEILHIAQLLKDVGGRALLVGGCVRDSVLGLDCKDYDMEIYGLSMDRIREILSKEYSLDFVGASFGARHGREHFHLLRNVI
jgi:tRNA nucleotidyltransferase (CCA-adding enzyme)